MAESSREYRPGVTVRLEQVFAGLVVFTVIAVVIALAVVLAVVLAPLILFGVLLWLPAGILGGGPIPVQVVAQQPERVR